jgi:hypothetical protein
VFIRVSATNNIMRPNGTCGLPTATTIIALITDASVTTAKLYYTPPDGSEVGPFSMTGPTVPPNQSAYTADLVAQPTWFIGTLNFRVVATDKWGNTSVGSNKLTVVC